MHQRRATVRIARRNHFTLFCQPQGPVDCALGLRCDSPLRRRSAPAGRAAATMEEARREPKVRQPRRDPPLRPVQFPDRGNKPAVLVAVGIAKHDLDPVLAITPRLPRSGCLQVGSQNIGRRPQIANGFKQRDHIQRQRQFGGSSRPCQRMARQTMYRQEIVGRTRHRHYERTERFRVLTRNRRLHQPQQADQIA